MPSISPERWKIISPHLDQALDLSQEGRASWLVRLRVEEPGLAAELEALLDEHATLNQEGFLAGKPVLAPGRAAAQFEKLSLFIGSPQFD